MNDGRGHGTLSAINCFCNDDHAVWCLIVVLAWDLCDDEIYLLVG